MATAGMEVDMSLIEVGLDPDAARAVAQSWSDTGDRCRDALDDAQARAVALMLADIAAGWLDTRAADGLSSASALLLDRAAAMGAIGWASPFASFGAGRLGGWGRARWLPLDGDDDDWIDASRQRSYLDLVTWLAAGRRGYLVHELADPKATEWAAMVATGTVWDGARAVQYLDIERDAGAGVVVVDFFIPEAQSLFLQGDGRAHTDPVFGDLDPGDSRAIMVFDLESGRASVQFDETCTTFGPCMAARPITLDESPTTVGDYGLPIRPNIVTIESEGRLEVDYDLLNSITSLGAVNGTFTLRNRGDGRYHVEEFEADEYPSVGVYQYLPSGGVVTIHRRDSQGVSHLMPWWPELPDLPDWSDLPDPPDIPLVAPDWLPDIEFDGPDLPAGPDLPDLPTVVGVDLPNLPKLPDLPKLPSFDLSPDIEGSFDPGGIDPEEDVEG
ncbi:MAG: hypothetical protein M3487_04290 [Actinomycetota bacterium]|nr:hypothetical protein [Actinomycetota bacterium]